MKDERTREPLYWANPNFWPKLAGLTEPILFCGPEHSNQWVMEQLAIMKTNPPVVPIVEKKKYKEKRRS